MEERVSWTVKRESERPPCHLPRSGSEEEGKTRRRERVSEIFEVRCRRSAEEEEEEAARFPFLPPLPIAARIMLI